MKMTTPPKPDNLLMPVAFGGKKLR